MLDHYVFVVEGSELMHGLSGSFDGQTGRTHGRFSIAHSPFFSALDNLSNTKKLLIAGLILFLLAFFGFWGSYTVSKGSINSSSASTNDAAAAPKIDNITDTSSQTDHSQAASSSSVNNTNSGSASNAASNEASVTVDGQSINVSTDSSNPSASVNKTINTENGSANVSIQSNVNSNAEGFRHSSQSVHVDSHSSGSSNTQIFSQQTSSGGINH
jgi:hypothetical protein